MDDRENDREQTEDPMMTAPTIFQCGTCYRVVGDTYGLVTTDQHSQTITLSGTFSSNSLRVPYLPSNRNENIHERGRSRQQRRKGKRIAYDKFDDSDSSARYRLYVSLN